MRYHNHGTTFIELVKVLNYCPLVLGIKSISRFI